mgnify:CR=1 FL=1
MAQNRQDMGSGPVKPLLLQLMIPAVVAQVVNLLYNIVDRIYIGHIEGIGAAALTFLVWYRRIAPRNLERALLTCCDVLSVACPCALGRGVRGTVAGAAVVCGSRTWLHELGIDTAALAALPDLHAQAKTELCVTRCGPTRRPPPSSA